MYIDTQNFWQQARVKKLAEKDLKVFVHIARYGPLLVSQIKKDMKLSNPYRQVNKLRALGLIARERRHSLKFKTSGIESHNFLQNYYKLSEIGLLNQLRYPCLNNTTPLDYLKVITSKAEFEELVVYSMLQAEFRIDAHFYKYGLPVAIRSCFYQVDSLGKRILIDRTMSEKIEKMQYICIDRRILYLAPYLTGAERKFIALCSEDPVLVSYLLPR